MIPAPNAQPMVLEEGRAGRRAWTYAVVLVALGIGSYALRGVEGWGTPGLHIVLEAVATVLAFFIGVLALVRFYSRKNNVFLFLGTGFLATSILDGFHAVASVPSLWSSPPTGAAPLDAWSWISSRALLALFFCLNWLGWRRERKMGPAGRVGERFVYLITGLLMFVTILATKTLPAPRTHYPDSLISQPLEVIPTALFLFALVGYLNKAHWRDNAFDHWLVISLIVGFGGEGMFMMFSAQPFDAAYDLSHWLKLVAYGCVTMGLLISVYSTFRQAEESAEALAREVVERERAQGELEVQKAYLEKLFENAPEAIVVLDEVGTVTRMNDEFTHMFGYATDRVIGRQIHELIVPDERRSEARSWRERVAKGQTVGYETVRRREDGSHLEVSVLGTAIDLEPGHVAIYEIYRDITDRKRAEEDLRRAKEEAEEATRAKSEFLAQMSHELRTPLNSVIGFANILLKTAREGRSEQEIDYLQRVRANGLHLLGLINDILDLSKIEAGKMTLDIASAAIDQVVAETLEQFRHEGVAENVVLLEDIPRDLAPIHADSGKLKQVLFNLVGNALKFTEEGSVTVGVVADPETRVPVRIDVIDTGIGIPPDRLRAIFEAFQQADSGTSRRFGGTGLGLSISRSLCALMGYRLTVESEPAAGSTFSVLLTPGGTGPDLASGGGERGRPAAGRASSAT